MTLAELLEYVYSQKDRVLHTSDYGNIGRIFVDIVSRESRVEKCQSSLLKRGKRMMRFLAGAK
jgi:hypothetical protein